MKKGFTLIELIICVAIIGIIVALVLGIISTLRPPKSNQAGYTSPTTERLEVVDGPLVIGGNFLYILRDKETEIEFVLTTDKFDFGALMPLRFDPTPASNSTAFPVEPNIIDPDDMPEDTVGGQEPNVVNQIADNGGAQL